MQSSQALFTKVYEQAQAAGAGAEAGGSANAGQSAGSGSADDNVVDGDFKEV